mmetsp:Transcript_99351/g.289961  ORF Transcript_99351/g.289961 Transcript_99351/m.289961 type:complete len:289 (+) Transcript_99351:1289-2155(+)
MRPWVPAAVGFLALQAQGFRHPREVEVAEVLDHVLPWDPEVPVVNVCVRRGIVAEQVYQALVVPGRVTWREAPAPAHAPPWVLEAQQAVRAQLPALEDGIRVPGYQARGHAHALDVASAASLSIWHRVCELRGANADHAAARRLALGGVREDLVPPRVRGLRGLGRRRPVAVQGDGLGDPACQVEDVGARIGALHVVGAAHDLREGLLQQRHPELPRAGGVRAEQAAVAPHRHAVVHDHLPNRPIEEEAATILAALIVHRSNPITDIGSRMNNAAEDRLLELPLILRE